MIADNGGISKQLNCIPMSDVVRCHYSFMDNLLYGEVDDGWILLDVEIVLGESL